MDDFQVFCYRYQLVRGIVVYRIVIGFEFLSPYVEIPMDDIADSHGQFPFSDQVLRFFSHLHLFGHIQLGAYDLYFSAMLGGKPHSAFVVSILIFLFVENPYGNLSLRDFFILQLGKQVG